MIATERRSTGRIRGLLAGNPTLGTGTLLSTVARVEYRPAVSRQNPSAANRPGFHVELGGESKVRLADGWKRSSTATLSPNRTSVSSPQQVFVFARRHRESEQMSRTIDTPSSNDLHT